MSKVFVLDTNKHPLNPIHPGQARLLLKQGRAAVLKRYPFTLVLKTSVEHPVLEPLRLKIDPGSKTTGLALLSDATGEVVWAAELTHRGEQIKQAMDRRRLLRRSRRQRKTRYRRPRFLNRRKRVGTLPPSLQSRVGNILTWVSRLLRLAPITALSEELVRFDTQAMQDERVQGIAYQQGTLAGYELRSYLLEKWDHACTYCGKRRVQLQVEHLQAKARGGTDRPSNLVLSCPACNLAKGTQDVREFLKDCPDVLARIQAQRKVPLKDTAAVNTTRWMVYERLKALGLPVETGSGGRTRYNRATHQLPKTHWLDAALVGASTPQTLQIEGVCPLLITAQRRQRRQMCLVDRHGFPRSKAKRDRLIHGYQTGDLVRAIVPRGKRAGTYEGRVAVKASGSFSIATRTGTVTDIAYRFCHLLQHNDGYTYDQKGGRDFLPTA